MEDLSADEVARLEALKQVARAREPLPTEPRRPAAYADEQEAILGLLFELFGQQAMVLGAMLIEATQRHTSENG